MGVENQQESRDGDGLDSQTANADNHSRHASPGCRLIHVVMQPARPPVRWTRRATAGRMAPIDLSGPLKLDWIIFVRPEAQPHVLSGVHACVHVYTPQSSWLNPPLAPLAKPISSQAIRPVDALLPLHHHPLSLTYLDLPVVNQFVCLL